MIDISGLMVRAEAEPKPRRRQNESACGAPAARFGAWVGPYNCFYQQLRMGCPNAMVCGKLRRERHRM